MSSDIITGVFQGNGWKIQNSKTFPRGSKCKCKCPFLPIKATPLADFDDYILTVDL